MQTFFAQLTGAENARKHANAHISVSSLIAKHTGRHVGEMGSGLLLAHPLLMSGYSWGCSTNPLTLWIALSNGFMSALKSRPEAPARLSVCLHLSLPSSTLFSTLFSSALFKWFPPPPLHQSRLIGHCWLHGDRLWLAALSLCCHPSSATCAANSPP